MKYSLKNEYKELLNEEVVTIIDDSNKENFYDIEFKNVKVDGQNYTVVGKAINPNYDLRLNAPYNSEELGVTSFDFEYLKNIKDFYCSASDRQLYGFLSTLPKGRKILRIKESTESTPVEYLNKYFKDTNNWTGANKKGTGEIGVHLAFHTNKPLAEKEPDAQFTYNNREYNVSVKSFKGSDGLSRDSAQLGGKPNPNLDGLTEEFKAKIGLSKTSPSVTSNVFKIQIDNIKNLNDLKTIKSLLYKIRNGIFLESPKNIKVNYVIGVFSDNQFKEIREDELMITGLSQNTRWQFKYKPSFVSSSSLDLSRSAPVIRKSPEEINDIAKRKYYAIFGIEKGKELEKIISSFPPSAQLYYDFSRKSNDITKGRIKLINDLLETSFSNSNEFKDYIVNTKINKREYDSDRLDSFLKMLPLDLPISYVDFIEIIEDKISNFNSASLENSSYVPKGKVLKEIYPNLFKKKLIREGGLAGHMMHPYEALDMTPRQIIDRIKEYSTSQKIIEKVDGQNLFFTVEEDGTLMFARNKEDMTHDDLVAKFTGHPAELPFVEGGNAIKSGVEQWLQSAGPAAEMEIREIFHPDGETKSFINFEIMHPDKPNQIVYDEKYIVFHSIIDFVNGRETTYATNKGQRLEKLIRLMDSGISSKGFTLASNRTVNLNELTSVSIEDYIERIKEIARQLNIDEDEFLGDSIEKRIKNEIEKEGIIISDEAIKILYDFVLYGESKVGDKIKSRDFTSLISKEDVSKLRSIGLTSAAKALKKVQSIISPFKDVFVDLGIDLLSGVKSAYMSDETNQKNIDLLKDKLQTAVNDLTNYMNTNPESSWEVVVHRLKPHLDKVIDKDIDSIVSTAVEGGVYDYQGDLLKVTGGFAPLNQILGAAYRDEKGVFPTFKEKFVQQESNRKSLKSVFNLVY